jgi:ubiquinone/menaquinone biosynthesis C-methylase UbiE
VNWWVNSCLSPDAQILEIGGRAGNCAKKLSEQGFSLTCMDLSEERVIQAKQGSVPNIHFKVGDATALGFPPDTFDVVYSHQMIKHLHPDDVSRHLKEVYRVLKKGGFYYFTTPNRLWGPSEVSRFFFGCKAAAGMHLKEFSYEEIRKLLMDSCFYELVSPFIHPYLCEN